MRLVLRVPAGNERGPLYMEHALAAIHQANPERLPLALEIGPHAGRLCLSCRVPPPLRAVVEGQLTAQYPDGTIELVPDGDDAPLPGGHRRWTVALTLRPDVFPCRRYAQFEDSLNRVVADPLTALLTTLSLNRREALAARIAIVVAPVRPAVCRRAQRCLRTLARPLFRAHPRLASLYLALTRSPRRGARMLGWLLARGAVRAVPSDKGPSLSVSASRSHEREEDLQAAADKLGRLLFEVRIELSVTGPAAAAGAAARKLQEMAGAFGQFSAPRLGAFRAGPIQTPSKTSSTPPGRAFLLSTEEVATLWHPPSLTVKSALLAAVASRTFAPPPELPLAEAHPSLSILGEAASRGRQDRFGILPEDRRRHLALLGKTGMGKSTLMYNLLASDIAAGRGVGLIDPHGDLVESLLPAIPRSRTNDVVLFDAGDTAFPLAWNPLDCPDAGKRPLVASGVVSAFKKLYGDSWGPRLEHILRNALLALLEVPGTALPSILRLLSEVRYRQAIVRQLADPVVRAFWEREFAGMPTKLQAEAIAPIQNKVGAFVSSPLLRNILGQAKGRLDLRAVMDDGRVLLAKISKGHVGEDAAILLGSLLVTSLQIAAMGRAEQPEADRRDFCLYVDEFQNFATESFATILSEARKYRLSLTLANQYLAQLDESTAAAVFGNVGTLLVFQVGAQDAELLAAQLGGEVTPQDLLQLPRYHAYARLLIDGHPSRPFSMRTLPPLASRADDRRAATIRRSSHHRYARPKKDVEAEIRQAFAHA